MTNEKFSFVEDVRDKKITARSARGKRTHTGKGGRVRLPSDNLTQKELKAMNGECKSYRLNEPMSWKEFKAMPDDIKRLYINSLRQKYNVPDKHICKMMNEQSGGFSHEMHRLGIPSTRKCNVVWDKDGFYAWVNRTQKAEPVEECCVAQKEIIKPCSGTLCFVGNGEAVLDAIKHTLGCETMKITISWEAV